MNRIEESGLPALSDAQLEIMQIAWDRGEVTVTDVWNVLSGRRTVARNTILTLMDRLEKKGWLNRRTEGQAHFYCASVPRQSTLGGVVQRLVDSAFAGSPEAMVLALIEGRGVSKDEADRIRKLIDNAQIRRKKSC